MRYIDILKDCFEEDFEKWLSYSNCREVVHHIYYNNIDDYDLKEISDNILQKILDILIENPNIYAVWFDYRGTKILYEHSNIDEAHESAICIDKNKIKYLLREIKLNKLGIV